MAGKSGRSGPRFGHAPTNVRGRVENLRPGLSGHQGRPTTPVREFCEGILNSSTYRHSLPYRMLRQPHLETLVWRACGLGGDSPKVVVHNDVTFTHELRSS